MRKVDFLLSSTARRGCLAKLFLTPKAADNEAAELFCSDFEWLQRDFLKISGIFLVFLPGIKRVKVKNYRET